MSARVEPIAVASRLYEALGARDVQAMEQVLHPDFVGIVSAGMPVGGGRHQGAAAMLRDSWGAVFGVFDVTLVVDEQLPAGDERVVVTGRYVGSERATGRRVDAGFAHVLRVAGDRVTELRQYTDTARWGIRTEAVPPRAPLAAIALVEWVRSLPYGRPSRRTVAAMMAERRGTCSTKHLFLSEVFRDRFPELDPKLIHRVHRVDRDLAAELYGPTVAAAVPATGVIDVHRYLSIRLAHGRVTVDVTFPGGERWNGAASMPLACGPGEDEVCITDPDRRKRELERRHCDTSVREPFIAALRSIVEEAPHRVTPSVPAP